LKASISVKKMKHKNKGKHDGSSDNPFEELPNPPIAEPTGKDEAENPFETLAIPATSRVKQIWALGGGKGGIGKSLVASSMAIALARMGHKVIAIDLDLGAANLHTSIGVGLPKKTLSDFFSGRTSELQDCVSPTHITNLEIISGAYDSIGVANIEFEKKVQLLERMRDLDADYLILDLAAGTNFNNLDFFLFADIGLLVLLPEPTSIENAYRFVKSTYFRRLRLSQNLRPVRPLIDMAMDQKNKLGIKTPSDLYKEIKRTNPEAAIHFREELAQFQYKLIVNQTRTQTDVDIGFSVKSVCKKYFGIDMDYVGYLDYDSAVWQAVRRKKPLMTEFPNSQLVSSIERIGNYLVKRYGAVKNNFF